MDPISCPHCQEFIIIDKLNCGIFRHGVLKKSGKQINPHSSKSECNNYIKKKMIIGCGKPFKVYEDSEGQIKIEICDYI
jgi:hypothetical protein